MRLGIIGTGRIAGRFVREAGFVGGIDITAVYNPHDGSAQQFVDAKWSHSGHDVKTKPAALTELETFWELVNAVYIATPHETHFPYVMDALKRDKHVLCEKPLCLKRTEAEQAYALAKESQLVLFEAIKTAYCPGFKMLLEAARSGVVGEIRNVEACFTKLEDPASRELTDAVYGGSFTELGSYVLLPALKLFGTDCTSLHFDSIYNERGIDLFTRAIMTFPKGMATLTCGLGVKSEGRLLISGTKGYLLVEAPWWKTDHFEAHFEDASQVKEYTNEFLGDGLRYEIRNFVEAVRNKALQPHVIMPEESASMAAVMEAFLSGRSGKASHIGTAYH